MVVIQMLMVRVHVVPFFLVVALLETCQIRELAEKEYHYCSEPHVCDKTVSPLQIRKLAVLRS